MSMQDAATCAAVLSSTWCKARYRRWVYSPSRRSAVQTGSGKKSWNCLRTHIRRSRSIAFS